MKQLLKNHKKIIIPILVSLITIIFLSIGIMVFIKTYIPETKLIFDDVKIRVYEEKYLKDIINNKDIELLDNYKIDTKKIYDKELNFVFIQNKKKYKGKVKVSIIDDISPTIFANNTYTLPKGTDKDFLNTIICGDNYDDKPIRKIIGEYDKEQIGTYELTYYAKDSSGNETTKDFKVKVINKTTPSSSKSKKVYFSDIVKQHKNNDTEIGIDVSKWQGEIDFEKVKAAGCEFVIIRLGYQKGLNGELIIDPYFETNIQKAQEADLKIGVYVYTYAKSSEDAITQAKWAVENVKPYELELGISYDWESWTLFNKINLSFYNFTEVANEFLNYVEEKGYKGMLYSSKYYLENIWQKTKHDIWLAHYATKTNYKGTYNMWQMTSNGRIDGINGAVDINILYK